MLEFLSILQVPVTTVVLYAVPFIVALMVIVFIHELGHFLVARWCGVRVEAFSIGFGKEIVEAGMIATAPAGSCPGSRWAAM